MVARKRWVRRVDLPSGVLGKETIAIELFSTLVSETFFFMDISWYKLDEINYVWEEPTRY